MAAETKHLEVHGKDNMENGGAAINYKKKIK